MKIVGTLTMLLGFAALLPVGRAQARAAAAAPKSVLLPSSTNPLVAIRLVFRTGTVDDPKGKEGLAALTAAMLGEGGTDKRTYAEVLDALYPLAGNIRLHADKEATVFWGTVHRDNLAAYADLLAQQVSAPRFDPADFARLKQDALDDVAKTLRGNDDESLGKQAMATMLYGGQPYGYPTVGTVAGLKAITLDDVKAFYKSHFTRDRLIVGVAGGYPEAFPKHLETALAGLAPKGAPRPVVPAPAAAKGHRVLLVEKGARAVAVSMGHPISVTRSDTDFYALYLAGSYLGEHRTFNGVLMNHLRGKRGLNYGDYAYIESFVQEGGSTFPLPNLPRSRQHFEIWLRPVPPQNALFAVRAALYEADKLVREGIPKEGFEATRRFLMSYSNLWTQDASRRLGYAIDSVIYGRDLVGELQTRLPKLTKADVDAAVKKHLHPENLAIAIVTDHAAEVEKQLVAGTPTPIVYDTKGTSADIVAEDKVIEKFPLGIAKDRITITSVDEMFERAGGASGKAAGGR